MADQADIWNLERAFWLDSPEFCRSHMAQDAQIEFLPPVGRIAAEELQARLAAEPRLALVEFDEAESSDDGCEAVLSYRAAGWGSELRPVVARCTSRYRRESGAWRMVGHHRVPQ
ncbi:hypothetical protein [Psychromarinibacter sp. S121]|uniref:hypothetical protein n=1 Tax=Psychromarinibacter sp. S121 TaxID=3415127 RepID=UPI003C7E7BE5